MGKAVASRQQPTGLKMALYALALVFERPELDRPRTCLGCQQGILGARVAVDGHADRAGVEPQLLPFALQPGDVNVAGDEDLFEDARQNVCQRLDGLAGFE